MELEKLTCKTCGYLVRDSLGYVQGGHCALTGMPLGFRSPACISHTEVKSIIEKQKEEQELWKSLHSHRTTSILQD